MVLIVCVDDNYGMGFNQRRQSRDRAIINEIIKLSEEKKIWIDPASETLFPEGAALCLDENFLANAGPGVHCFAECMDVTCWLEKAERIVLFRWNRVYPSDVKFPYEDLVSNWKLVCKKEFSGHSHKMITMEVYQQ